MTRILFSALVLAALIACDRDGRAYTPQPIEGYPGIAVLGELEVLSIEDWSNAESRQELATFHTLGPADPGEFGGATATFQGNGETVCVFVDPEAVFWNKSVSLQNPTEQYMQGDNPLDDGDIDLEVGLSAYYTGSPGLEIGTFEQPYEDSLGNQVTIEFNECLMVGNGSALESGGAHSGRATAEYCDIDTSLHPDREYTVLLRTWSVPLDDYLLSYGVAVIDGSCTDVVSAAGATNNECILSGEGNIEGDKEYFAELEEAFCLGEQAEYCDENPGVCG